MFMKTGDILLFFGGDDLIDREIDHYEKSVFTHAAIAINKTEIVEAWWEGVRTATLDGRGPYAIFETITPLNPIQQTGIEMYARGCVGKRYNYPGIFGFLVREWFGLKHNPFGSIHSLWCSQLVFDVYRVIGLNLLPGLDEEDITPADLANSKLLMRKGE